MNQQLEIGYQGQSNGYIMTDQDIGQGSIDDDEEMDLPDEMDYEINNNVLETTFNQRETAKVN